MKLGWNQAQNVKGPLGINRRRWSDPQLLIWPWIKHGRLLDRIRRTRTRGCTIIVKAYAHGNGEGYRYPSPVRFSHFPLLLLSLLPVSSFSLKTGWTPVEVSNEFFLAQIPARWPANLGGGAASRMTFFSLCFKSALLPLLTSFSFSFSFFIWNFQIKKNKEP